jgi:hypothetical protein
MKRIELGLAILATAPLLIAPAAQAAPSTLLCTISDGPRAGQTFEVAIDEAAGTVQGSKAVFTSHEIRWGEGSNSCEGRTVTGACLLYKTADGWGMKTPVSPDSDDFRSSHCVAG